MPPEPAAQEGNGQVGVGAGPPLGFLQTAGLRPLDEHDLHGALLLSSAAYASRTALSTGDFLGQRRARAFSRLRLMAAVFLALLVRPPSRPRATAWRFFIARESNTNRLPTS